MSAPLMNESDALAARFSAAWKQDVEVREGGQDDTDEVTPEVEETPEPEGETLEPDVDEVTPEAEEAQAPEADDEEPEVEDEEVGIKSTMDLAKAWEIDHKELSENLAVPIGDEMVPLAKIIERAQAGPTEAQVQVAVAEQRQALEQARQAQSQATEEMTNRFLAAVNLVIKEKAPLYSDAALAKLREEDQESFLLRAEEKRQFEASMDRAITEVAKLRQEAQAKEFEEVERKREVEAQAFLAAIPEWSKDHDFALEEAKQIGAFSQEVLNLDPEEVLAINDHRVMLAIRGAYLYHKLQQNKEKLKGSAKNKILRAPKTVIPTRARRPAENVRAKNRATLRKRQRETADDPAKRGEHRSVTARLLSEHF